MVISWGTPRAQLAGTLVLMGVHSFEINRKELVRDDELIAVGRRNAGEVFWGFSSPKVPTPALAVNGGLLCERSMTNGFF